MAEAVGYSVGRTVVAGGNGDGYSHSGGSLKCLIHRGHCRRRPCGFRTAPTDRDHGRVIRAVVNSGRDRIQKAGVGVVGEVSDDFGAGRNRARDFYIEHDFAVRAVWISGGIVTAVADGNRRYVRGLGQVELFPVVGEIGWFVSAA